jgi:hypothetical protein
VIEGGIEEGWEVDGVWCLDEEVIQVPADLGWEVEKL